MTALPTPAASAAGRPPLKPSAPDTPDPGDDMTTTDTTAPTLTGLAETMRSDSEFWFPALHASHTDVPLFMHYTLGLIGEAGEVANIVKKINRDGYLTDKRLSDLGAELADVLIYLLLLAGEVGVDIVQAYADKRAINVERWGDPAEPAPSIAEVFPGAEGEGA